MCGRFALGAARNNIIEMIARAHPDMDLDDWIDQDDFQPRYNVAPRSRSPVIRRANPAGEPAADNADGSSSSHANGSKVPYVVHTMKWGLVPSWSKFEDTSMSTINARAENLVEGSGMWGGIKGRKRCAVICQGYYEWQGKGKHKIPHFTCFKDKSLMLLAGMYDCVHLEGQDKPLWTFTIVTTDANKEFSWLHDRQPVILSSEAALKTWLDTSSQTWSKELVRLLLPYSDSEHPLDSYPVPKDVGKVGAESPTFIEPISQRKDGIQAMFAKQVKAKKEETPKPSTSSSSTSPLSTQKRKREDDVEDTDKPGKQQKPESEQNAENSTKPTSAKAPVKQEEASSDVEIVDVTETRKSASSSKPISTKTDKSPKKSSAKPKMEPAPSNKKITQFFGGK